MNTDEFLNKILKFRDLRDWEQFHNPKDLAISLSLESSELLEHFQWKNNDELEKYLEKNKQSVGEELSDILYYTILISHELKIDLPKAFLRKMKINEKKYPIKKSKGKSTKYKQL